MPRVDVLVLELPDEEFGAFLEFLQAASQRNLAAFVIEPDTGASTLKILRSSELSELVGEEAADRFGRLAYLSDEFFAAALSDLSEAVIRDWLDGEDEDDASTLLPTALTRVAQCREGAPALLRAWTSRIRSALPVLTGVELNGVFGAPERSITLLTRLSVANLDYMGTIVGPMASSDELVFRLNEPEARYLMQSMQDWLDTKPPESDDEE